MLLMKKKAALISVCSNCIALLFFVLLLKIE